MATAKMGDDEAFETLVKRHRPRILSVVLRYIRVREDAEDVVQQTFLKMFVYLKNFEGKSSFATWLTSIAINEALMLLRRGRVQREVSLDDLDGDEETRVRFNVADASPNPEASCLQREGVKILSAAMGQLNPGMRAVLEFRDLRELSVRETARRMGLSVGAVKARLFQGRRKLRRRLGRLEITPKRLKRSAVAA
ncbi:MAG TPA: sigma-70 family RNA polymerase sigma factor [Candidatus Acidoferrum sp.]|nr:sigma-70 family RNA polymerase sigma factor [Candidatus Acidoferrum sp.]